MGDDSIRQYEWLASGHAGLSEPGRLHAAERAALAARIGPVGSESIGRCEFVVLLPDAGDPRVSILDRRRDSAENAMDERRV